MPPVRVPPGPRFDGAADVAGFGVSDGGEGQRQQGRLSVAGFVCRGFRVSGEARMARV